MSCEDIPSLLDLQKVKKHADDFGRLMGTGTGTSTNEVTGQVRPTYNKVIADMNSEFDGMIVDMNSEFDAQILNMGFTRIGTFASGATITNPRQTLLWDVANGGDGQEYGWSGVFPPSGKVVSPGSTPLTTGGIAVGAWMSRFDPALRVQTREALRRSYAEAGYNLVAGSFEAGFTLSNASDVALNEATGKAFSGATGTYAAGTSTAGFVDRSLEPISLLLLGAIGDGVTDDGDALANANTHFDTIPLLDRNYNVGTTPPDFRVSGPGNLISNGVQTSPGETGYNPELEIFSHTPVDYQRAYLGITYPPPPFQTAPGTQKRYRTICSLGSQLGDPDKLAGYVTAFGNFNGANFNQWFAVDAFGGDTLMYAYNVERTVAVGSESLAWFGAPSADYLKTYKHDWWRKPTSNPYLPGDPLWNPNGLATIFPTLSAEIGNYSAYATSTADASYTVAVGRDAGNHTVKGTNNVFVGYSAAQDLYAGDRNVAVGSLSMQSAVFATQITAVGRESGRYCKDSIDAVFVGHGAGRTVQNASRSVYVGARTGDRVIDGEGAVIIGYEAGKGHASLNNVLSISNNSLQSRKPLIGGKFDSNYAGVNADPSLMRAKWHVRNADSGSTLTPAVGVLVEGINQSAVTVETANTGFGSVRFADPENIYSGGMEYSHSSDSLSFFANGASRVRISATGELHPTTTDNTQNIGKAANRWAVIYAGTGTINTSDAREKTAPLAIDDAVLDAWGDVQLITFQWLESIRLKGEDGARWHFGVIAQQVRDAFAARGLDGTRYGLLCYDEWDDQLEQVTGDDGEPTGEMKQVVVAGNRWGIRPDQCLFLEAAYQRRRCDRIEERLTSAGL